MRILKTLMLTLMLGLPVSGCLDTTGMPGLATASLSPEAARLQASSEKLKSYEEQQRDAKRRVNTYSAQGAALGAAGGAILGGLTCAAIGCDSKTTAAVMIGGGVAGAAGGGAAGRSQAKRQNTSAEYETAMKQRISVAGKQLSQARTTRTQAQQVAATHQRNLAKLKASVAAGRAPEASLKQAQTQARADAAALRQAKYAIGSSASSVADEDRLNATEKSLSREQTATEKSYDALIAAIENSKL